MPHSVVVSTGSRLHFGLLSNGRVAGRQFGGAGLMIDRPGFTLRATMSDCDEVICSAKVSGSCELEGRVLGFIDEYRRRCSISLPIPRARIEVVDVISAHAGLGSGTQLGMAIAQALATLSGEAVVNAAELALRVGRGARSALGVHGFQQGGFLVEGGKTAPDEISPLVARVPFPEDWRLLLVRPTDAAGLSGAAECSGFSRLAPMPDVTTDRLCRVVLMQLLPAAIEANFELFSDGLYEFGHIVGDYFSPVQGGTFAHPAMPHLARQLRDLGIRGVAQTSWGPTLCVLCPDEITATALAGDLGRQTAWSECELIVGRPLNRGARVREGEDGGYRME